MKAILDAERERHRARRSTGSRSNGMAVAARREEVGPGVTCRAGTGPGMKKPLNLADQRPLENVVVMGGIARITITPSRKPRIYRVLETRRDRF